ncbi:MAG: hypothetical protein HZA14_03545 [Nitrospirae bacterium]|nr:hypothetical protein [Nitrospirota bacterium]
MNIDGRTIDVQDVLIEVRELLSSTCGKEVNVEIQVKTIADAKRITAFASMSGCKGEIENRGDHYSVQVSGIPCCS